MSDLRVYIDGGNKTEELIQAIYDNLKIEKGEDAALDAMDVERGHGMSGGVVNEPVTVCAVLTFSVSLAAIIAHVIEKHWEYQHQERVLNVIVEEQKKGRNIRPLVELAKADGRVRVEVSTSLPDVSKVKPIKP